MSYKTLKIFLLGLLIFYSAVGVGNRLLTPGDEDLYPFFSWFLFSQVPARIQNDFSIRIIEANGQKLDPPVLFEKTSGLFNAQRSLAEFFQVTRNLGVSISQKDQPSTLSLRKHLENNLFSSQSIVYEVLEVKYNPIERFKTGKLIEAKRLDVFRSGEY